MDDLRCRKRITINACPMCLADEETIDHLISSCRVAQARWRLVLRWLDCSWVFPRHIGELFEAIAFAMCLAESYNYVEIILSNDSMDDLERETPNALTTMSSLWRILYTAEIHHCGMGVIYS